MAKKQTLTRLGRPVTVPPVVDWGKSKVVKGESVDLQKIVTGYSAGYQPHAHQDVTFEEISLQDMTEDQFDLPDVEQFKRLDVVEQVQVRSNLQAMQNAFNAKFEEHKNAYQANAKPVKDPIAPEEPETPPEQ